jgi:hypothetical protein
LRNAAPGKESAFKNAHQRAGAELFGNGGDILQPLRFAEGAQKTPALHPRAAQQPPFGENDGPRNNAEREQGDQNELGHRARAGDEVENFAAHENC